MSAKASRRLRNAFLFVLVVAILYATYRYALHRFVESKLDEIRKQGYPVTLAELEKLYPQPSAAENAASAYRNAFAKNVKLDDAELNIPIVGYSNLPPRGESLPQPMSDGIALFLKSNEESMALLHTATKMAHCRFTSNLNVLVIQRTEDGGLRHAARKLEVETVYASNLGDDKSTAEALLASIGLVRHFSEEPLAISRLVQQACFGLTKQALEHGLSSLQLDSNQLARVSSALAATEASLKINKVLADELAWNVDAFSILRRDNGEASFQITTDFDTMNHPTTWKRNLLAVGYRFLGILDLDELNYLRLESTALRISQQPLPQRIQALDAFVHETNTISVLLPVSRFYIKLSCQQLKLDGRFIASLRATRAGVSVESYRSEHDQLPDSLPSNLTDPFTGQPLRYKKLAKGYVVYSVGEDGKDDGGDEKKDITFTVER